MGKSAMDSQETKMVKAAGRGNLGEVRKLVLKGVNVDAKDEDGRTPLIESAEGGHLDVVRFLVERRAALEVTDHWGSTPLLVSAEGGLLDVVCFLIEQGAALEATDNDGDTPLLVSADEGHLDVVRFLVKRGANVSAINDNGDMPLICLLRRHDNEDSLLPVVRQMLLNGASPVHRNKRGVSVLDVAREKDFHQLEQMLQEQSKAELSSATEAKTSGILTSGNLESAQTVTGLGQVSSNSDPHIGDEHDARQLAGSITSYTHLDAETAQVPPEMPSPLISNLVIDKEGSNTDSFMAMLKYVADRCNSVNEAAPLYRHILFRLRTLATAVIATNPDDESSAVTLAEVRAISIRLKSLLDANVNKPVVLRLVSVRAVVDTLTSLHTELDRLETSHSGGKVHEWSSQWDEAVALVKQSIVARIESSLPTLINELSTDKQQIEAMTLLICELKRNKQYYSHRERDLMHLVHTRIVGFSKLQGMDVEGWFIPQYEVEIHPGEAVGKGAFGVVYRGMWRKSEIVVKSLNANSDADKRNFFREVAVWHRIRHHNIVRFLGACHLASPYFMVCEYAPGGSLPEYLYRERQKNRVVVWRKLHEVSLGLFYLHGEEIVHGDLKGDNILVAKDGTAMLTDFGLSFMQSATVPTLENLGAIRWRAPEYVVQDGVGPSFAADVYSLAMVIVETITRIAPWKVLPDAAVRMHLRKKEMLKRPINCDEMTDEAWDLVSRMSVYEPSERMALSDVVDRLKEFADAEEDHEWQRTRAKPANSNAVDNNAMMQNGNITLISGTELMSAAENGRLNDHLSVRSIAIKRGFDDVKYLIEEYAEKPSLPSPTLYSLQDDLLILRNDLEIGDLISDCGAFGVVYCGTWKRMDVVIKELRGIASSAEMRTFLREARVWHGARHKNIVSFFGANDRKPPFFLVSEYASNGNLMDYLKKEKENGKSVVWRKILDVAVGLEVLHSKGIIHGDLKGNNVVVSADGTAMLTDFGLSFFNEGSLSMPANLNPRWRAPEYVNGTITRPAAESDVYSLGMCIVEILTGEPPWAGLMDNPVVKHHLKRKIPMLKPSLVTDREWELVRKMICYTRSERISLKDAIASIEQFANEELANTEVE